MDGIIDSPSPNFDARDSGISMVVLHYTGMRDAESAIARLRDAEAHVSCHYLIGEDGRLTRLHKHDHADNGEVCFWVGVETIDR